MNDTPPPARMARIVLPALIGLLGGFAGAALFSVTGVGSRLQGDSIRAYLLANPEVLPEAVDRLRAKQQQAQLAPLRQDIETPFPGAVLGNPKGSVTLVEFSDYACGFCRASMADVDALIAANPDLKVVIREYPILSSHSAEAARMALAAAEQGRFAAFHKAMFETGSPAAETIEAAATKAGLDLPRARQAIASGKYDGELAKNAALARQLGIDGTPGWAVGEQLLAGAIGKDALNAAIEGARKN